MFERYEGTAWHRVKLLVRGITGLFVAFCLTVMTAFLFLLEVGNRAWDTLLEDS